MRETRAVVRVSPVAILGLALLLALQAGPASAGAVCGDGVIDLGEECDDGGVADFDGCTRTCRYEAIQHVDSLALHAGSAPSSCVPTTNQLGNAFSALGLPAFNNALSNAVASGQLIMLFDLLDLDEAVGQQDAGVEVGLLGGVPDPADPSPGGFDAWYLVGDAQLDGNGRPSQRLTGGSIAAFALAAGPSNVSLPFLGGTLNVLGARFEALVDTTASTPAPPPFELAPGLVAFETLDAGGASRGLCGNLTVGSLAAIPVPPDVTVGGNACSASCASSRSYVACGAGPVTASCHSLLDLLVGGCRIQPPLCFNLISPTQPDLGVGGNPPHALSFADSGGGIEKVVVVEPGDAYSSWFSVTSERVHATDNLNRIFNDGFESAGTGAWSATLP